jgi:hypothetical protein
LQQSGRWHAACFIDIEADERLPEGRTMTYSAATIQTFEPTAGNDTLCRQGGLALLALRTKYGLSCVTMDAMDRITALQVGATLEFLRNNLPVGT